MQLLVTGANGCLGRRLIRVINQRHPESQVVALVRSEQAAARVRQDDLRAEIHIVDYRDARGIAGAGVDCDAIVHLAGIIRETRENSFAMAHEQACEALNRSGLAAKTLVCLGIIGSDAHSPNACLSSRGRSEAILQSGGPPATIIRVPMVLGPGDYAAQSLAARARAKVAWVFRAASLEQPIDSDDVVEAILAALSLAPGNRILALAGPESLTRGALVRRTGQCLGKRPIVISLPLFFGWLLAWLMERISDQPPLTRAMLGVLDHDDRVDTDAACRLLGITLTDLDDTLRKITGS